MLVALHVVLSPESTAELLIMNSSCLLFEETTLNCSTEYSETCTSEKYPPLERHGLNVHEF